MSDFHKFPNVIYADSLMLTWDQPDQQVWAREIQTWWLSHNLDVKSESFGRAVTHFHLSEEGLQIVPEPGGIWEPFRVGWESSQMAFRQKTLGRRQPLARAVGVRPQLRVFDGTFGLGKDAFFLATMGCQVEGMEQSPVIFLLVSDGLRRLKESAEQALVVARMKLSWGDSMSFLQTLPITDFPDVIYLDPMYPLRKKSALPKKELQWLRSHIGANLVNDKKLLQVALSRCRERVVVKRPRKAPPLAESVWQSFSGSTTRYDVYRSIDLKKGSQ